MAGPRRGRAAREVRAARHAVVRPPERRRARRAGASPAGRTSGAGRASQRIYDTSDPRQPREVGWFIPPEPTVRFGPQPRGSLVLQSEDVLVDVRGYIYLANENQGLWILEYTGPEAP